MYFPTLLLKYYILSRISLSLPNPPTLSSFSDDGLIFSSTSKENIIRREHVQVSPTASTYYLHLCLPTTFSFVTMDTQCLWLGTIPYLIQQNLCPLTTQGYCYSNFPLSLSCITFSFSIKIFPKVLIYNSNPLKKEKRKLYLDPSSL